MNPVFAKANRGVCYPNWIFAQLDLMLLNPFAFTFTLEHRTLATKLEKLLSVISKEHLPISAAYSHVTRL